MSLNEFGKISKDLSRNPLGIISLFLVLVYAIAGLVTMNSSLDLSLKYILIIFMVSFPVLVLVIFYKLVTKHYNKLYAPNDFSNEDNFMRALELGINKSEKINNLESITEHIQKQISEQPLYRYTELKEEGKQLILIALNAYNNGNHYININEFINERKFESDKVLLEVERLSSEYSWVIVKNNEICITERGKKDMNTFIDFIYARFA